MVQKAATIRLTGPNSKAPGTPYINTMWEIESGECKGFTAWHRLIPGEHEIQQTRIAQYMQAVCGKNSADVVHDEVEDGGKVTKIGGRNPVGVKAGMTFQRKKDTQNAMEGEETPWIAEAADIIPGWKPKSKVEAEDEAEPEDDDVEDEIEDDEDVEEPEDEEAEDDEDDSDDDADEDEGDEEDEDDSDEEEADGVPYEEAAKMSLVQLKKLAKDNDYEDSDLTDYKGPQGKKALLTQLVEDEIVAADGEDEPPF